jgi:hypothetical protein
MPSVLTVDPGIHTGYAFLGKEVRLGTLALPPDHRLAVEETLRALYPLLLCADEVYVEDWTYQGRNIGQGQVVPLILVGGFLALGAKPVDPLWKRSLVKGLHLKTAERLGVRFPSGLDEKDRALWLRLHLEGWGPLLGQISALPKKHRPHALDALGLAFYARSLAKMEKEGRSV